MVPLCKASSAEPVEDDDEEDDEEDEEGEERKKDRMVLLNRKWILKSNKLFNVN